MFFFLNSHVYFLFALVMCVRRPVLELESRSQGSTWSMSMRSNNSLLQMHPSLALMSTLHVIQTPLYVRGGTLTILHEQELRHIPTKVHIAVSILNASTPP